jgi:hypothetical protein
MDSQSKTSDAQQLANAAAMSNRYAMECMQRGHDQHAIVWLKMAITQFQKATQPMMVHQSTTSSTVETTLGRSKAEELATESNEHGHSNKVSSSLSNSSSHLLQHIVLPTLGSGSLSSIADGVFTVYNKCITTVLGNSDGELLIHHHILFSTSLLYNTALAYHRIAIKSSCNQSFLRSVAFYQLAHTLVLRGLYQVESSFDFCDHALPELLLGICNNMGHIFAIVGQYPAAWQCHQGMETSLSIVVSMNRS